MEIYEKIKNRRKELGLTADYVAEVLGVSRSTVYRYESSEIEKFPINSLIPLCKVLKCSPGYLMGWDDTKPAAPVKDLKKEELIRNYDKLNDSGKERLLEESRLLAESSSYRRLKDSEDLA